MMTVWQAWVAAFDASAEDGDWQRLVPFLTEDVVYVVAGVPFGCELRGRDAVLAGFARSIANFDARFDERRWQGVGVREFAPGAITGRAQGWYRLGELPPLTFSAQSQWFFRGDRICLMTDIYDVSEVDAQAAFGWLAAHGAGMDPRYTD